MPDNRFPFSKARIEALVPPAAGRDTYHDEKQAGLILRLTPNGCKTFYLYRKIEGRPERLALGRFPETSVEQARKLTQAKIGAVADGKNPAAEHRAKRGEPVFADLWEHWQRHSRGRKRESSIQEDERQYNTYLAPWHGRRLSAISRRDVTALHTDLAERSGPYQANRVLALVKSMFYKADGIGWSGANPACGVTRFPEEARDRFLSADELPRFFEAVKAEPSPILQAYFLTLLFTGVRRRNAERARWEDIDLDRGLWRLPETKGKPMVVVLSPPAVEVLRRLRQFSTGEWVFPGNHKGKPISDPTVPWKRVCGRAGIHNLRLHDLRRTMGSWQALTGATLQVIGKSLGHVRQETTAIYARLTLDPVREAVDKATAAMLAAANGKLAEVIDATASDAKEASDAQT